jgi:hypothetical protein
MSVRQTPTHIRNRVFHDHLVKPDDEWDFHEWIWTEGKVKADRTGRPNGRIISADWQLVRCNNIDCPAEALIHMGDVLNALPPAPEGNAS